MKELEPTRKTSIRNEKRKDREPALLDCQGTPSCGRWVSHIFHEAREVIKDGAWEEIYRCTKCGAERRWGLI